MGRLSGILTVNSVSETRSEFFSDGSARRIEFSLTLTRVDESLTAMYGDLRARADGLLGQAGALADKAGTAILPGLVRGPLIVFHSPLE